jgi:hypothetical protein
MEWRPIDGRAFTRWTCESAWFSAVSRKRPDLWMRRKVRVLVYESPALTIELRPRQHKLFVSLRLRNTPTSGTDIAVSLQFHALQQK